MNLSLNRSLISGTLVLAACWAQVHSARAEAPPLKPGLPWVQFHSPDFTRPAESGLDPRIDLDTGKTIDGYSRLWCGWIKASTTGEIQFVAEADDGVEVWIDERPVIEGWGLGLARRGKLVVRANEVLPVEVRFFQSGGAAHLRLFWAWQGHPRELVPASAFCHRPEDAACVRQMMEGKIRVQERRQDKSHIYGTPQGARPTPNQPVRLGPGPHLLLGDKLIERSTDLKRTVNRPRRRLQGPIVTGKTGKGDDCFQPYLEVIRDPKTRRFRLWYGVPESAGQSHLAYMESDDGIHWIRPHRVLGDPSKIQFGVSILDEGPAFPDPTRRFKYGYYGDGGLRIAVSPDGLTWTLLVPRTVLPHKHDINNIFRDPLSKRYMAMVSTHITGERWSGHRRCPMMSESEDLIHWRRPWLAVTPDDRFDEGETQFYGVCGFLVRGGLMIGMVKVLRDDLPADAGGTKRGIGYTTLAWSDDGEHWTRDREVFFDRHPKAGTWDHAMAWIDCQVPVGDEVYLYYGGYANGHKVNRFEERQIGLVRIQRDRYVARQAGAETGVLQTVPVVLDGGSLRLNVNAGGGEARVQVLGADGAPIEGLTFTDCRPIKTDSLDAPVQWRGRLASVKGKTVRLEFSLRSAKLFAFELAE